MKRTKRKAIHGAVHGASAVPSGQGALPLGGRRAPLADDIAVADQGRRPASPWQARERSRMPRVSPSCSGSGACRPARQQGGRGMKRPGSHRHPGLTHRKRWPIPWRRPDRGLPLPGATSAYGDGVIRTVAQGPFGGTLHRSPPEPRQQQGAAGRTPAAGEARQAEAAMGGSPCRGRACGAECRGAASP